MTDKKRAVALGFFDGLHTAHRTVLRAVCDYGATWDMIPTAVTFDVQPRAVVRGEPQQLIDTKEARIAGFLELGIEEVEVLCFDSVRNMKREDFIKDILIDKLNVGFVASGYDFRFGKNGEGDVTYLKDTLAQYKIPCITISKMMADGSEYASCTIREFIRTGKMEQACSLLGRPHRISGEVIHGKALGRTIGSPTMNVAIHPDVVIPKAGVYVTKTTIDGKTYQSVTNILSGDKPLSETYVFDFVDDVYGKEISVDFLHFLRDMRKFNSLDELKGQIEKDALSAKAWFSDNIEKR